MNTILALDKQWEPHRWVGIEDAIVLEAKNLVLEHLGTSIIVYHGGINRVSGNRSMIETSSIIVVDGTPGTKKYKEPTLTNASLFARDMHVCAYCGEIFRTAELTRDHLMPTSKGGKDSWTNVVTACKSCNTLKGDLLPGHKIPGGVLGPQLTGKMDPLYVPYIPCRAEHMILKNRSVKADQMAFLLERITNKKTSRIYAEKAKALGLA